MLLERRIAPSFADPRVRRTLFPLALVALVLMLAAGARAGLAADLTVNSTADAVDANPFDSLCATSAGACTLRAAIQQANASNPPGGTTIHLPAGTYVLTLTGGDEDSSATGDLDLLASNGVSIAGAGASSTHIDANGIDRVLDIRAFANATISGVSITGGTAAEGGGVRNNGTAAIVDVSINSNGATAGGGIYNAAAMAVTGGNVGFNTSQGYPGNGGGIYNAGTLTLENGTIHSNQAYGHGGGVYNAPSASASLKSVTIAGNAADPDGDGFGDGGGVYNDPSLSGSGILEFGNTIIANNTDFPSGTPAPDCFSVAGMTSLGYNLVRDTTFCTVTGGSTDITGVDPLLQPLATNGGTSGNMALGAGSPALDAGNPDAPGSSAFACPVTDQRGISRPMDGDGNGAERCDIGAFERVPSVSLSITKTDSHDPVAILFPFSYTITVTNGSSVPAIGVVVTDPLPSGVVFSFASTGCSNAGGTVTCTFGDIAAGANAAKTIDVLATTAASSPLINTATITGGRFVNVNPAGSATAQTTISSADVTVSGFDGPDPVSVGGTLTYTITLGNAGPGTATGVTLTAYLSTSVTLSAVIPSQGSCSGTTTVICTLGTIPLAGTATVTIQVTARKRGDIVTQFVMIPGSDDPNGSNNGVNLLTTVLASPFVVNSTADLVDATPGDDVCAAAGGACTLRAAVMEANASAGGDTIILPAGTYTLSLAGRDENGAATGDLDIAASQPLTITGAAAATTIVDGGGIDRVFHGAGTLTISHVTIRNGDPGASQGGGILAAAPLTVRNAIVSGNHASLGGGIANVLGSPVTVESSTISGNQSGSGGGISSSGGLTLLNVTVSGNSAPDFWGGGMDLYGTNTLRNVTIANNSSPLGGGIMVSGGSQTLTNTIIANNTPSNCYFNALFAAGSSYNLDTDNGCGLTGTGDKPGQNPLLGALQNNGGPTPTHALGFGSPAVDAGIDVLFPLDDFDQRGVYRPRDGDADGTARTDIGAYEASYPPPTITSIVPDGGAAAGGETVTITGTYLLTAAMTIGSNGVAPPVVTATTVTFTTPPHAPGPVNVNIETVGGAVSAVGGYTYFPLASPAAFSATATGTQVSLSWSAVSGATGYEIWRSSLGGAYALWSSPAGTAATDPGLAAETTYLYQIRAMTGATPASAFATDAATTIVFTDAALSGEPIRAVHVSELRTAVNAMRAAAGLGAFDFTDPALAVGVTPIARLHLTDLRTALDAARATAGLPAMVYTDPAITANLTQVKAVHLMEVRAGTQ